MRPDISFYTHGDPSAWVLIPFFLFLSVVFALVCRLIAGSLDGGRVEEYIHSIGGRLLEKHWQPFGPGWFGTHGARIYQIVYEDSEGRIHGAHLKTSMLGGVYLTNDAIVGDADSYAATDGMRYDATANGRIRLERGIPVADYSSTDDEVAARSAQQAAGKPPAYRDLLAENEQLKARIHELEKNTPRS